MNVQDAINSLFRPRFVPDGVLIYTRENGFSDGASSHRFRSLRDGSAADEAMPDVVLYCRKRKWWFLIDIPDENRRFDAARSRELRQMFSAADEHAVLVAAFPSRLAMAPQVETMSWDLVAWVCDEPSHLIHFDGHRIFDAHAMNQPLGLRLT